MIQLLATTAHQPAAKLVLAALRRSVSYDQANWLSISAFDESSQRVELIVTIDPNARLGEALVRRLDGPPCKIIVLGALPDALVSRFGATKGVWPDGISEWAQSPSAPTHGFAESPGRIVYRPAAGVFQADSWTRPLERFDFTDEWNNLGFGAVRADGSCWSLSAPMVVPADAELAGVKVDGASVCSYAGLFDTESASLLWFNRAAGPIDSYEWAIVERFLADHRADELPCQPVLQEVPVGYDAAVTMRLDCDEEIESARALWGCYRESGIPFSLAVHTSNLRERRHDAILRELDAAGGGLLSHTATHAPDWGGSYGAASQEACESARAIEAVTGRRVHYAVSPFHQSPEYALAALADAGYRGCIGGIIRNDPHFLLARGGELAGLPRGFVGHSQQCMLHGDCLLEGDDPIAIYRQAFDQALETGTLFGYLDHPFSERYAYGWADEATRTATHEALISHIRVRSDTPLFLAENTAMDWLCDRAAASVASDGKRFHVRPRSRPLTSHRLAVSYQGRVFHCDGPTALA